GNRARSLSADAVSAWRGSLAALATAVVARSASDEAIHSCIAAFLDCFAEPVIGRRFAPTRWLAMTELLKPRCQVRKRLIGVDDIAADHRQDRPDLSDLLD